MKIYPCENAKEMKQTAKSVRGIDLKELEDTITAKGFNQFAVGTVPVTVGHHSALWEGATKNVDVGKYEMLNDNFNNFLIILH